MTTPYSVGQFVWCNFPYPEAPNDPGPIAHVGYIAKIDKETDPKNPTLAVLYTTSSPATIARNQDREGFIAIDEKTASGMNQKPFMINTMNIAFLPSKQAFFPDLGRPPNGVVARAPKRLMEEIRNEMMAAIKRHDPLLEVSGPDRGKRARAVASARSAQPPAPAPQATEQGVTTSNELGPNGRPVLTLRSTP